MKLGTKMPLLVRLIVVCAAAQPAQFGGRSSGRAGELTTRFRCAGALTLTDTKTRFGNNVRPDARR
jgi:hypothetical protein